MSHTPSNDQTNATAANSSPGMSSARRRLLQGGLAGAPVVLTTMSSPVLGATCNTHSRFTSMNTSRAPADNSKCNTTTRCRERDVENAIAFFYPGLRFKLVTKKGKIEDPEDLVKEKDTTLTTFDVTGYELKGRNNTSYSGNTPIPYFAVIYDNKEEKSRHIKNFEFRLDSFQRLLVLVYINLQQSLIPQGVLPSTDFLRSVMQAYMRNPNSVPNSGGMVSVGAGNTQIYVTSALGINAADTSIEKWFSSFFDQSSASQVSLEVSNSSSDGDDAEAHSLVLP